jgi:hypothetical protein
VANMDKAGAVSDVSLAGTTHGSAERRRRWHDCSRRRRSAPHGQHLSYQHRYEQERRLLRKHIQARWPQPG